MFCNYFRRRQIATCNPIGRLQVSG